MEPLAWSDFFDTFDKIDDTVPIYTAGNSGIVYICLHGAGHSAMSFACLAAQLKTDSTVVAFDFRGHGKHYCEDETNMAQETLIDDTLNVIKYVHKKYPERTLCIVGHSMGGSIATKTAHKIEQEYAEEALGKAVAALYVIDVVEGSAMDALPFMEQIAKNRPVHFPDLKSVIRYGVQSG